VEYRGEIRLTDTGDYTYQVFRVGKGGVAKGLITAGHELNEESAIRHVEYVIAKARAADEYGVKVIT
jgi:hypothetical protein